MSLVLQDYEETHRDNWLRVTELVVDGFYKWHLEVMRRLAWAFPKKSDWLAKDQLRRNVKGISVVQNSGECMFDVQRNLKKQARARTRAAQQAEMSYLVTVSRKRPAEWWQTVKGVK